MNVLDLFSGIGGFSLGLERAGMRTVAFCEIDPFCRRVLKKHWPDVPIYDDVTKLTAERLRADGISIDVICGGFPCQDISYAGEGAGIDGERSGLWKEYARLVGELRPRYVIVENVAALLGRGIGRILGDLAEIGYDAEWNCIPASAVGAPHQRDRVWITAYPLLAGGRIQQIARPELEDSTDTNNDGTQEPMADAAGERCREARGLRRDEPTQRITGSSEEVADSERIKRNKGCRESVPLVVTSPDQPRGCGWFWSSEPDVGRVAYGVPDRAHRLRALGNAVVPQIPEIIGRAIMKAELEV